MADRIGIDLISVLGMSPVDYVALAAGLGCTHITLAPKPVVSVPELYPQWNFHDDPALLRDTVAALSDHGIAVAGGEGFFIVPGRDVAGNAADLDILAELGAGAVTACAFEPDQARAFDQLAVLAGLAGERGMGTNIEFVPSLAIGDLPTALAAVNHVGRPDFGLVVDAMHIFRSGATAADVAALDPAVIGHIQLCDVPLAVAAEGYGYEASFERRCPGEGELPLADLVAALPGDRVIGLEIPMKARALAGEGPADRLRPCVAAARNLLAQARSAAEA
ncbi:MAG: sugar phosphate isomerase/epimerase [Sphingobium sp.]